MTPELHEHVIFTLLCIIVGSLVYLVVRWFQDQSDRSREDEKSRLEANRQHREYVVELEKRNRYLETCSDDLRAEVKRLMWKELEHAQERRVTSKRLSFLANELKADDNTRSTRVFKPEDLHKKLSETNRTMNIDPEDLEFE